MEKTPVNSEPIPDEKENEEAERIKTSEKMVKFLDRAHIYEDLQELREHHKGRLEYDDFKDILVRINGIVRDISIQKREMDGENVEVSGWMDNYKPPRQEDKEGLIKHAYKASEEVEEGDEKYLIPAVINAAHPFVDGNGRTARLLHLLLQKHDSKENFLNEVRDTLLADGRTETTNVNPGLIAGEIEDIILARHGWDERKQVGEFKAGFITMELDKLERTHPSYDLLKKLVKEAKGDAEYTITALSEVITKEQAKELIAKDGRISILKMAEVLSYEELEEVIEKFWEIKKEYVDILIDIFVHPDQYKTKKNSKDIRVKELFIEKIIEEAQYFKKE